MRKRRDFDGIEEMKRFEDSEGEWELVGFLKIEKGLQEDEI